MQGETIRANTEAINTLKKITSMAASCNTSDEEDVIMLDACMTD